MRTFYSLSPRLSVKTSNKVYNKVLVLYNMCFVLNGCLALNSAVIAHLQNSNVSFASCVVQRWLPTASFLDHLGASLNKQTACVVRAKLAGAAQRRHERTLLRGHSINICGNYNIVNQPRFPAVSLFTALYFFSSKDGKTTYVQDCKKVLLNKYFIFDGVICIFILLRMWQNYVCCGELL